MCTIYKNCISNHFGVCNLQLMRRVFLRHLLWRSFTGYKKQSTIKFPFNGPECCYTHNLAQKILAHMHIEDNNLKVYSNLSFRYTVVGFGSPHLENAFPFPVFISLSCLRKKGEVKRFLDKNNDLSS